MRELFKIDLKNYAETGSVYSRPSVRGIIQRDEEVLLVHSKQYDYFMFPGGGIEPGESHGEALKREVQEETGYLIAPDSIEEFGAVPLIRRDELGIGDIFEQVNYYYFCKWTGEQGPLRLEEYEASEGYEVVWMNPVYASAHNRHYAKSDGDLAFIRKETKVLDMVDLEMRRREHIRLDRSFMESLGNPEYQEALDFVEAQLLDRQSEDIGAKKEMKYSRFAHTKRVLRWAKRLYDMTPQKENLKYEELILATILHDVGRANCDELGIPHATAGVPVSRDYLLSRGYSRERADYIAGLVGAHSDKELMGRQELDPNLVMLMEADLLDDTGAAGVVMDCMITTFHNREAQIVDCLDHLRRFTCRIQTENPMITPEGCRLWAEKTRIVNEFERALSQDVE